MDPLQDNGIQQIAIPVEIPGGILPNEKPENFSEIPEDVIESFSVYMQVVVRRATGKNHQEIDVKNILNNASNMFREGPRYRDEFWMQHTAASIREIVCFLNIEGEDFFKAHRSIPAYATDQYVREQLDKIVLIRSYLSDIVHFVPGNRLGMMHKLYPRSGYGTMRKERFFVEEEDTFEKVCIDLVYILNDIFVKYCVGVLEENNELNI